MANAIHLFWIVLAFFVLNMFPNARGFPVVSFVFTFPIDDLGVSSGS